MTRKRLTDEVIISALIECGTVKGASDLLGCSVRTIYDRQKNSDFKQLYTQAKTEILKTATAKLQGNVTTAVDTLVDVMTDEETAPQTRANAAAYILQYALRFTETADLIERLEQLEQTIAISEGLKNEKH